MTNTKSRILDEMQETSSALFTSGVITKRKLAELEKLCNLEVDAFAPQQIKSLREKSHLSQSIFAAVLNISVSTVQKWEIGDKKPSGASLKLLHLLNRKGLEAIL
jgi:putative transcriptional regulator